MKNTTMFRQARLRSALAMIVLLSVCLWAGMALGQGIDPENRFAWTENTGWLNFKPSHGEVSVYATHLEGHVWGENIGWIRLGTYTGGGEHTYENTASDNFGVNRDGPQLSGYAWGENIGWISFGPSAQHTGVRIDTTSGDFSGYAWGENVGWIKFAGTARDDTPYKVRTVVQQTGSLQVTIMPPEAATAGVQWRRVGTSIWRDSGDTEHNVPVGPHVVEFKAAPGWAKPGNLAVNVETGETTIISAETVRHVSLPGVLMLLLDEE